MPNHLNDLGHNDQFPGLVLQICLKDADYGKKLHRQIPLSLGIKDLR